MVTATDHLADEISENEHRWNQLSRWGGAWRVLITSAVVSSLGILLLSWRSVSTGQPVSLIEVGLSHILGILLPIVLSVVMWVHGPWLKRFLPFTQALLFGLFCAIAMCVGGIAFALILDGTDAGFVYVPVILMFAGIPAVIVAVIGYSVAMWEVTPLGSKIIWAMFAVVYGTYALITVLVQLGLFSTYSPPMN